MPVEPRIVEEQLRAVGEADRWWSDREVRELPAILNANERIHAVVTGRLLRWLRPSRRWLIAVTDDRLVCVKRGERFGRKLLDVPLARVTSVAHRAGLLSSKIIIASGEGRQRIRVGKADALKLLSALSALIQRIDPRSLTSGERPPAMFATHADHAALQARLDLLEDELERMRQQVDFLEELLKRRESAVLLEPSRG